MFLPAAEGDWPRIVASIAWCLRRGFHKTGVNHPFPSGDDRFGAPLRDDLSFVVLEKALAHSDGEG